MKRLLVALLVLCAIVLPSTSFASPFLVCDPYLTSEVQPDEFVVSESGKPDVTSPAQILGDGSRRIYYDAQGYSAGTHTLSVKARKNDPVWGVLESTPVPFEFTRPSNPVSPRGIGLTK